MSYSMGGELDLSWEHFLEEKINQSLPYAKKHHVFVDTGRSALYLALSGIIQQGGKKEAWLPRFCCDSVVQPFRQLGFTICYYSMGSLLQEPGMLPARLEDGTFLFINYFGKKNTVLIDWLTKNTQKANSLYVVEDNVQASLSTNCGKQGDFVVNSYRKFLPQPDGAVLAYDQPMGLIIGTPDEAFVSQKLIAKLTREKQSNPQSFLDLIFDAESRIDHVIEPRAISFLSQYLFERTDLNKISRIRRNNWFYLFTLLQLNQLTVRHIFPVFNSLEDGEVPLGFPIKVDIKCRDRLRQFLTSHNIYCPIHWSIPMGYDDFNFAEDIHLSKSIMTLPIDQRVDEAALDYLVDKLIQFFKQWEKGFSDL